MELRTYTRIHAPFPTYCAEFAKELTKLAYSDYKWSWWARDDGRIVNRELLSKGWVVTARETDEG
jgi:hypothetical protein